MDLGLPGGVTQDASPSVAPHRRALKQVNLERKEARKKAQNELAFGTECGNGVCCQDFAAAGVLLEHLMRVCD